MNASQSNGAGGNSSLAATEEAIRTSFAKMDKLEATRAGINDQLNAERKALYANHGITPSALARARTLSKLDEDKRQIEQLAVAVCEKAMGIAQTDLFDNLDTPPKPEPKKRGRPSKADAEAAAAPA